MENSATTTQNPAVNENEHGIQVLGLPLEDTKEVNAEAPIQEDETTESLSDSKKQETVIQEDIEAKPEPTPKEEKQKAETNDKEEVKKSQGLKIDFGNSTKSDKPQDENSKGQKQEAASLTKESVLEYLKSNGFENLNDISELSKPATLNDEVEKFKKYNEETGRGINDFYNMQKDWKTESSESRIKEFMRLKYPTLTEDQIETQYNVINVTEEDEDMLSTRELNRAKAEFDKMDSDATAFLTSKMKEYKVSLKQAPQQEQQKLSEEDVAKAHRPYWEARDKSLNEFNEFSFNIDGLGEITVGIDSEDKKAISQRTETIDSMVGGWKGKDDSLDTKQLVSDNAWSIPAVRQKMLVGIAEQVHALTLETFSKQNRNVNLDDLNKEQKTRSNNNGDLTILKGENHVEQPTYGTPLFGNRR